MKKLLLSLLLIECTSTSQTTFDEQYKEVCEKIEINRTEYKELMKKKSTLEKAMKFEIKLNKQKNKLNNE